MDQNRTLDRRTKVLLDLGQLLAAGMNIDLQEAERALADDPGPEVYIEFTKACIDFARRVRDVQARLGNQRQLDQELASALLHKPAGET